MRRLANVYGAAVKTRARLRTVRTSWKLDGAVRHLRLSPDEHACVMRTLTTSVGVAARLAHAHLRELGYDAGDDAVRELMLCRAGHAETVRRVRMLAAACPPPT